METPGIRYFTLKQPLPGTPVGTIVNIDADGKTVWINGPNCNGGDDCIDMAINLTQDPAWFEPVTDEQHIAICKENTILYIMELDSCNRTVAKAKLVRMKEFWEEERISA